MVLREKWVTAEEFDTFVFLPENVNRNFELIQGRIHEVVSNSYSSEVAALVLIILGGFVRSHQSGRVTGADGGYSVAGERYIPDVAFISKARQPVSSRAAYNPNPPDLAVEVLSPTDDPADMRAKVVNYLHSGTILWIVDPEKQQVEVYTPGQSPYTLDTTGTLDGGTVLPGFTLPVKDIFPA